MNTLFTFLILFIGTIQVLGQDNPFSVSISSDTLLFGNQLEVRFTIVNTDGDFEPPAFANFDVVAGPNTSSRISVVNGEMTQSKSYSYYLLPRQEGIFYIEEAFLNTGAETLNTIPVEIFVKENPEGIIENPQIGNFEDVWGFDDFPSLLRPEKTPSEKKRKSKAKRRKI